MGCCLSCCRDDEGSQDGEANERTNLLSNPVSNVSSIPRINSPNSYPVKTDEQSALNKILHETATNVIDVASLRTHEMGHHEYLERMDQYHSKIAFLAGASWQVPVRRQCLLKDIPVPEKILSSEPISQQDYQFVKNMSEQILVGIRDLKVEQTEDLVVPFIVASSSDKKLVGKTFIQLNLVVDDNQKPSKNIDIELSVADFYKVLHELEKAKSTITFET